MVLKNITIPLTDIGNKSNNSLCAVYAVESSYSLCQVAQLNNFNKQTVSAFNRVSATALQTYR
uniref:Uncharacterized protein n=1 Tax=Oryza nivara TaxID=4536 RepID=A0A0E0J4W7_ORYNI